MDVCNLDDFKIAFKKLDVYIDDAINEGNSLFEESNPLIVRAIGGFALIYHNLRFGGVTADVDDVCEIPLCYKDLIKKVGHDLGIPEDWLNDHSQSTLSDNYGKWEPVDWELKHICLYVLNTRELLIDKIGWAEKNLSGVSMTDRDILKDYNDFLGILWKLGIEYDTVEMLHEKLSSLGIDLNEYPSVSAQIQREISDDGINWPDGHI